MASSQETPQLVARAVKNIFFDVLSSPKSAAHNVEQLGGGSHEKRADVVPLRNEDMRQAQSHVEELSAANRGHTGVGLARVARNKGEPTVDGRCWVDIDPDEARTCEQKIIDNTMRDSSVEGSGLYDGPCECPDREHDHEVAWVAFEECFENSAGEAHGD